MPCCFPWWVIPVARDRLLPFHRILEQELSKIPGLLTVSPCLSSRWPLEFLFSFQFKATGRSDFWGNKQVPGQNLICLAGIWCPPLGQSAVVWEVIWSTDSLRTRGLGHQGWQDHPAHSIIQELLGCTSWCQRWQPWSPGAHPWEMLLIIFFFGYVPSLLVN